MSRCWPILAVLLVLGCSDDGSSSPPDASTGADAAVADAAPADAAAKVDAAKADAAVADASAADAASADAGCARTKPQWGAGGDWMLPGTDCLSCHRSGGSAKDHPYTVAGTVFTKPDCPVSASGVTVRITDADGVTENLTSNAMGNFFTARALKPPLKVSVIVGAKESVMKTPVTNGSCNVCHKGGGGGRGWLALPGEKS